MVWAENTAYIEPEGRPVGVPRKSDKMLLKPIIKEINVRFLDWIHLAQDTVQ